VPQAQKNRRSYLAFFRIGGDVDEHSQSLADNIRKNIPFASAVAFIVVVMVYLPCLAATTVFAKEAGSWRYAFYLFIFTSITAYSLAFIAYRVTLLIT
jgi:ferrous iron transport protein B